MEKEEKIGTLKAYKERFESASNYEKKLRSIVKTGHEMAYSRDMSEIMPVMLTLAVKICGAQFAAAALTGKNDEVFVSGGAPANGAGRFPLDKDFKRDKGLSGLLMRTKKRYICNITEGDEYLNDDIRTDCGIKNYISTPLLVKNNDFIGMLEVYNKNRMEPFNENDADILDMLAAFTAAAVERFRIYAEFGKFGDEIQKVVDEAFEAEAAFRDESKKFESTKMEIRKIKADAERAADMAVEILKMEEADIPRMKEKAAGILRLINREKMQP
jgi:hypothetical protein